MSSSASLQGASHERFGHPSKSQASGNCQSAAIHALFCDDIFSHILRFLTSAELGGDDQGKASLASLANVCRAVSAASIPTLWRNLDSFRPVAALLDWASPDGKTLSGMPRILHDYTAHARSIRVESAMVPSRLLSHMRLPLFPHLVRLVWVVECQAGIDAIGAVVYFSSLSLLELQIDIRASFSHTQSNAFCMALCDAMHAVANKAPNITLLKLAWDNAPPHRFPTGLLDALSSLRKLETISLAFCLVARPSLIRALSELPYLRSVEITHYKYLDNEEHVLDTVSCGFPCLDELRLDGPYSLVQEFAEAMPVCAVHQCGVSVHGSWPDHFQQPIIRSLASKFERSIHTVSLSFPGNVGDFYTGTFDPFAIQNFDTLLTMNLVDVRLSVLHSQDITDSLVSDMASAWPNLHTLRIVPVGIVFYPPSTMVTLRGLRALAERCAGLADVLIQVNGSGDHWAEEAEEIPVLERPASLILDLTTSMVTSPRAVAAYLRRCFPSLYTIRFNYKEGAMCGQPQIKAWEELSILMTRVDPESP